MLPRTLQPALSDMYGVSQGGSFEPQAGMSQPKAIRVFMSTHGNNFVPVFSGDQLGPDLSLIPFRNIRFWVGTSSLDILKGYCVATSENLQAYGNMGLQGKVGIWPLKPGAESLNLEDLTLCLSCQDVAMLCSVRL
jgi:hypothetical protein